MLYLQQQIFYMPIINTDDLMSIRTFAKKMRGRNGKGVSTQRVYNMISAGELSPIKIDGLQFLTKQDLEAINSKNTR